MVGIPWPNRLDPKWKKLWPPVRDKLEARMVAGHLEYGDRSFERSVWGLLDEVEEELLDQIIWSFIDITRVSALRDRIKELEESLDERTGRWESREEIEEWLRKAR